MKERSRRFLMDPRAYLMDPAVLCMSTLARGIYSTLLMHMWDLPEPGVVIAQRNAILALARCSVEEWEQVSLQVEQAFDTSTRPGWWIQKRMVRVHAEQAQWLKGKTEAGRRGGKSKAFNGAASTPLADLKHNPTGVGVGLGVGVGDATATHLATDGGRAAGQLALGDAETDVELTERAQQHITQRMEWLEAFTESFWPEYPRKVSRPTAQRAWMAIRPWTQAQCDAIYNGLLVWREHWKDEDTPMRLIPHPATWLNGRRWEDKP